MVLFGGEKHIKVELKVYQSLEFETSYAKIHFFSTR